MTNEVMESYTGRTVDVGGIRTHYHDIGSGATLLLLRGSGRGVSACANWLALAKNRRWLALDLVGFGETERPAEIHYSLQTWTDHVWAFLDALGIDQTSVVGNSLGARIALELARAPERVDRMVLMGSPGVGMTQTPGLKALREYQPSEDNMRQLILDWMVADPSVVTDHSCIPVTVRASHRAHSRHTVRCSAHRAMPAIDWRSPRSKPAPS